MPKRLKEGIGIILRELRPHALWDVIKLVILLLGGSGIVTQAYRLLAHIRGLPQDYVADVIIFSGSILLLALAYLIGRIQRRRTGEFSVSPAPKRSSAMPLAVEEMNPPPHDP